MNQDANARSPVEDSECVSGLQIGVVIVGISITLPLMYSAGEVAQGVGLGAGIAAVLLAALILSLMSIPAAIVGSASRLSSYMIIEHTFGYVGAKIINLAFGIFLLGWYAVTAELFGRTLYLTAAEMGFGLLSEPVYLLLSSALVMATTLYGFKAIDRLALVAVPLLLLCLVAVSFFSLRRVGFGDLLQIEPGEMEFTTAVSAVIGAAIVGVVLTPDLTRYAASVRDCIVASFVGQGGGMCAAYLFAMIPVLVFGELEPVLYLFAVGAGFLAVVLIVFATWTTNVINLYSTALAARASVPRGNYLGMVLLLGILGTVWAWYGVAERLIDFLLLLGILVPPVAGVYLSDFFLLGKSRYSEEQLQQRPALDWTALLVVFAAGGASALLDNRGWSPTGLGALDSLVISALLYLLLRKLGGAKMEIWNANRH